jgi:hypothetical protein
MLAVEKAEGNFSGSLVVGVNLGQTQAEFISCGCWCHFFIFGLWEGIQLTQLLTGHSFDFFSPVLRRSLMMISRNRIKR